MSDRQYRFTYAGQEPERLDKALVAVLPDFSRSRLQGLVKNGFVRLDGEVVTKAGILVEPGCQMQVILPPPEPSGLIPEHIPLNIVYENQDVLVINKTAGMVVHPAAGHTDGTLVHAALAHAPEMEGIGGERRPGIVHRLDKDTSGLIMIAKNERTHRWLQDQFRLRQVQKVYLALVDGSPPTPAGRVEAPIARDPSHRKQMAIVSPGRGRDAVSEYFTVESFPNHTLLEVHPLTGRTHQIRLHLSFLGCPIAGDRVYGHKKISIPLERQFLHAARLKLRLPDDKTPRAFEAPLPSDLQAVLDFIRKHG